MIYTICFTQYLILSGTSINKDEDCFKVKIRNLFLIITNLSFQTGTKMTERHELMKAFTMTNFVYFMLGQ